MHSPQSWMANAAALLARLEQVVMACAAPAQHEQLLTLLRQYHADDLAKGRAVLLPCAESRTAAYLTQIGALLEPQPMPLEALVHGAPAPASAARADAQAAREQGRAAAREKAWLARASKPARALRNALLARRAPHNSRGTWHPLVEAQRASDLVPERQMPADCSAGPRSG